MFAWCPSIVKLNGGHCVVYFDRPTLVLTRFSLRLIDALLRFHRPTVAWSSA
jgi:hypothetical protein